MAGKNEFFEWGMNFSKFCDLKSSNTNSFMAYWNEFSKSGIFNEFVADRITLSEKNDIMRGLGYGLGHVGILFSINVQIWAAIFPLLKFGSEEQKAIYLSRLCTGELIGAHAISESESGSDVFNMQTYYEKTDSGYLLNGTKCFVSNVPEANLFLIYAKKRNANHFSNISCFVVSGDTEGLITGKKVDKMGMNLSPFGDVILKDCLIPHDAILGSEGKGMAIFNYTMTHERPFLLAFQVGIMEKQFDDCLQYVKTRSQGKKRIIENQAVSNRIADMKSRLTMCQLLLDDYILKFDEKKDAMLKSSIAKLCISEMLVLNCMDAMRNYATLGYINGYNAASQLCDSLGSLFYSGTSDIQRNIISSLV